MRKQGWMVAVGVIVMLFGATAQAAVFTNGSFEVGGYNYGNNDFNTLSSTSTAITGWEVGGSGIDWINAYWTAANGTKSIDLAGTPNGPGRISQTFDTTSGMLYDVSFAMAGNPDDKTISPIKALLGFASSGGSITGATIQYFNTTGSYRIGGMNWTERSFQFLALGDQTTLTFENYDLKNPTNPWGAALDDVKVTGVPEAGALFLFGTGLVGLVGYRRVRRMQ
jgi:choice-of-anchor C domain-containing protein